MPGGSRGPRFDPVHSLEEKDEVVHHHTGPGTISEENEEKQMVIHLLRRATDINGYLFYTDQASARLSPMRLWRPGTAIDEIRLALRIRIKVF